MDPNDLEFEISKDHRGRIREIAYSGPPYKVARMPRPATPRAVAAQFVKEVLEIADVKEDAISNDEVEKKKRTRKLESELWFVREKSVMDTTVVEFEQRANGVRVWRSGVAVRLKEGIRVLSTSNRFDYDLKAVETDSKKLKAHAKSLVPDRIAELISLEKNLTRVEKARPDLKIPKPEIKINKTDHVVYRFDPEDRQEREQPREDGDRELAARLMELVLPKVDKKIKPGRYLVATEVFFSLVFNRHAVNFHALIDPETDSTVRLRVLVAQASGWVYEHDPLTTTGDTTITPGSTTDVLNAVRTPKPLPGNLALPNLQGEFVEIAEVMDPVVAAPSSAAGRFDYDADTDDFSATNAYFHMDGCYRYVADMGFDIASYFNGTTFPVPVDHRGCFGCVNAASWGNATGDGQGSFTYGLVEAGQPVGIAASVRIVWHEFGHTVCWDNVSSPNLGFAHSTGDSFAAILCDPRSKAPDRYATFPWLTQSNPNIDRRHDREIPAGWAWGGNEDDGGYGSEQILSTSHFRAYQSLGGDHPELCEREWAARYMMYLMLHAIGTLTPATNPGNPEEWVSHLTTSDLGTTVFEGHPGGTVHKVIRWAFEKQGAFQAPGVPTPVTTEGEPPEVDVFINDGRNGEYPFTLDYCHTADIWNRIYADEGGGHQSPVAGIVNHAYVIVRNRGTEAVEGGRVGAYQKRDSSCCGCCDDCQELVWPNDFMPTITRELSFGQILPGDYEIVGPFEWRPGPNDCLLMAVDVKRDLSNIVRLDRGESLPVKRLVPFDNNIALRCLCKQCHPDNRLMLKRPCREEYDR